MVAQSLAQTEGKNAMGRLPDITPLIYAGFAFFALAGTFGPVAVLYGLAWLLEPRTGDLSFYVQIISGAWVVLSACVLISLFWPIRR
jgi:hypothetical protein